MPFVICMALHKIRFSSQFSKIISHYKRIGYNSNVLLQTACMVMNIIMVDNFAFP